MSEHDSRPTRQQRNLGTVIALTGLLSLGGGLFALMMVVVPITRGFVWIAMVVAFPALFHYFIWGRWMSRIRNQELDTERKAALGESGKSARPDVVDSSSRNEI